MEATCLPNTTQFLLVPQAPSHEMMRDFKGNGLTTNALYQGRLILTFPLTVRVCVHRLCCAAVNPWRPPKGGSMVLGEEKS
jgi:hypothetical protein